MKKGEKQVVNSLFLYSVCLLGRRKGGSFLFSLGFFKKKLMCAIKMTFQAITKSKSSISITY